MKRSEIMEIEWECVKLSNEFAYLLDNKQYRKFSELFTEDGVFVRDGARLAGRAAIVDALEKRPSTATTRHVTTGHHLIHVDETTAKAICTNRSYFGMSEGPPPADLKPENMILLDFEDTYRKTDEGWRIAERKTQPVLVSDSLRPLLGLPPR